MAFLNGCSTTRTTLAFRRTITSACSPGYLYLHSCQGRGLRLSFIGESTYWVNPTLVRGANYYLSITCNAKNESILNGRSLFCALSDDGFGYYLQREYEGLPVSVYKIVPVKL